ncbi:MAG: hypothetical protein HY341_01335 [Candidatus Kerfeldbacteria bacterium]|nr:hypothetical protein [Candidatus Kerfeldbacteria bacterium]
MRTKLIVFEGIDGSGKSTISQLVARALRDRGIPAIRFRMFTWKRSGFEKFKPYVKHHASREASLFYYLAMLTHEGDRIRALLKNHWVIADRYVYTTLAQHAAWGVSLASINVAKLPLPRPDYCFHLVVREEIRRQRLLQRKTRTNWDRRLVRPGSELDRIERVSRALGMRDIRNDGTRKDTVRAVLRSMRIRV